MEIRDWLLDLWKMGLLCDEYKELVCNAVSKRQIMDIVLDANGISFLQEMQSEGHALPYEYILEKFGPYLNGRYIYDANGRYTSAMYCCCGTQTVTVETTNVAILGCDGTTFEISDYDVVHLYADRNSNINIKCPRNAKCYVDLWRGGRLLDDCIRNDNIIVNFR